MGPPFVAGPHAVRGRDRIAGGDVEGALRELIGHCEHAGDAVIRNLALEDRIPAIGQSVRRGRAIHRDFCARVFSPWLPRRRGPAYDRRLAQFIVACDIYTWKLFRRDHGLDRAETTRAMRELLDRLTNRSDGSEAVPVRNGGGWRQRSAATGAGPHARGPRPRRASAHGTLRRRGRPHDRRVRLFHEGTAPERSLARERLRSRLRSEDTYRRHGRLPAIASSSGPRARSPRIP